MTVPIRLRITTDEDECRLIGLRFSETMFVTAAAAGADSFWKFCERTSELQGFKNSLAKNESILKLGNELKKYGVTFRGKTIVENTVKALKLELFRHGQGMLYSIHAGGGVLP